jgi:hypothetical protein
MKSSALRMTRPEQLISCSPWSATSLLPVKSFLQFPCSTPPGSEACAMWFPNAKRGIANAMGQVGKLSLHHLRVPPERHLTERP